MFWPGRTLALQPKNALVATRAGDGEWLSGLMGVDKVDSPPANDSLRDSVGLLKEHLPSSDGQLIGS